MNRYWWSQKSIWIKVLIAYQRKINVGTKRLKNPKPFTDYSQTIDDVNKNIKDYNQTTKWKMLIVFDDLIADMEANKK